MQTITVQEFYQLREDGTEHQLIDVREPNEYQFCNIGGELIPLSTVTQDDTRIRRDVPVIVMCRSGKRSATAIAQLETAFGLTNLINLEGGILQWADEIDASVPKY
jgi:adenylyltransferase/sulfurtransferase